MPRVKVSVIFGYGLFAIAACVIVGAHLLSYVEKVRTDAEIMPIITEWAEDRQVVTQTTTLAEESRKARYHKVYDGTQLTGYIFRSEDFTDTVDGYAGPMAVIAFTDPNGTLIDFRITRSSETPRYIDRIREWMDSLKGTSLFTDDPIAGVNAVSGATLSSEAILQLLRNSGQQFAVSVLGRLERPEVTARHWSERVDWPLAFWGAGALIVFGVIFHGRFWSRLIFLAFTVGVGGFWLNKQFSTAHIVRLLSADALLSGPLGGLCLLLGVPLLALLFGNLYCGYLCPFGALQEWASLIVPKRVKAKLPLMTMTLGRSVKYGVLFILVVAVFILRDDGVLEMDPLIGAFDRHAWSGNLLSSPGLIVALLALLGGLFVTRLWCRYLCPTGAFLALFNRAGWLGRWLPPKKFGRCEFGLGGRDHSDCIHCDRCRYQSRLVPKRDEAVAKTKPSIGSVLFLAVVLGMALLTLSGLLRKAWPGPSSTVATEVDTAPQAEAEDPPEAPVGRQRRGRGR